MIKNYADDTDIYHYYRIRVQEYNDTNTNRLRFILEFDRVLSDEYTQKRRNDGGYTR